MKLSPKAKIVHPGYGSSNIYNQSMDFVFSEDVGKWQRKKQAYVKKNERVKDGKAF